VTLVDEKHDIFVMQKPCGCLSYLAVCTPDMAKQIARMIAKRTECSWKRVPAAEWDASVPPVRCPEHEAAKQGKLIA
jgi:hypothetical protein